MGATKLDTDQAEGKFIVEDEDINNPICSMRFVDQTARESANGWVYQGVYRAFSSSDLRKVAAQEDDDTLWQLIGISPTVWKQIDTPTHARGHSLTSTLDHTDVQGTPSNDDLLRWSAQLNMWVPSSEGEHFPVTDNVTVGGVNVTVSGNVVTVTE
jgi:hypothetical protein